MSDTYYHPTYHRLWTPLEILNILMAGGLRLSTINEFGGPPRSAKTGASYQIAERFLKDYGDRAQVDIIDPEQGADFVRLETTFHISPCNVNQKGLTLVQKPDPRVMIHPADTLEAGLAVMLSRIKYARDNKKFLLIIYDSISASLPEGDMAKILDFFNSGAAAKGKEGKEDDNGAKKKKRNKKELTADDVGQYQSGMMARAKTLKDLVTKLQSMIFHAPVCVIFINQATTEVHRFFTRISTGGGYGVKHHAHNSIWFNYQKTDDKDIKLLLATKTKSSYEIRKSKHCPMTDKPIHITVRNDLGGRISPIHELQYIATTSGLFEKEGRMWVCSSFVKKHLPKGYKYQTKKFYEDRILEDVVLQKAVRAAIREYYCENFMGVKAAYDARRVAKAEVVENDKPKKEAKTKRKSSKRKKRKAK